MRGLSSLSKKVEDRFTEDEPLTDQNATNQVRTFTFTKAVDMVVVFCDGARGRASVSTIPTASRGIVCEDGVPTYIPVMASQIQVYVSGSGTVSVVGLRY